MRLRLAFRSLRISRLYPFRSSQFMGLIMRHQVLDGHARRNRARPGIDRNPIGVDRPAGSSSGREVNERAHNLLPLNTLSVTLRFPPAKRPNCAFLALANCQRSLLIPCSFQGVFSCPRGTERREESTRENIHRSISEVRNSQRLPTLTAGSRPSRAVRSTVFGCRCKRRATSPQSSRRSNSSCGSIETLGSKLLLIQKRRRR